jgi:CBS domain containing-hemolysin-like protein
MPPPTTDVDTVGGFVIELFGRIPRPGETADHDEWRFQAEAVEKSRLRKVRVVRRPPAPSPEEGEPPVEETPAGESTRDVRAGS